MIEAALALSLLVRHWTDAVIIGVLLGMNGLVGFVEEHQAASAIAALKQRLATQARVRRNAQRTVPARELVVGDVVRVRLVLDGNRVTWAQSTTKPVRLNLSFDVTIDGDQLTGRSKAGRLPGSAMTYRRDRNTGPVIDVLIWTRPSAPHPVHQEVPRPNATKPLSRTVTRRGPGRTATERGEERGMSVRWTIRWRR